MLIIGLTGSIGMGKSTTADLFREFGIPVQDSDAVVHELYANEAAPMIEAAFPGVVVDGRVDRQRLAPRVLGNPDAMRILESIVHPLVRQRESDFLAQKARAGAALVVLDIPLLFESRVETSFDAIVVVSAAPDIQADRVLKRPGMTADRFRSILERQTPDAEKRRRAHFVVDTGHGLASAKAQVAAILRALAAVQTGMNRHA